MRDLIRESCPSRLVEGSTSIQRERKLLLNEGQQKHITRIMMNYHSISLLLSILQNGDQSDDYGYNVEDYGTEELLIHGCA